MINNGVEKNMDKVCRIAVSDENMLSMLRAVLALGGLKCENDGKILVTDDISAETSGLSAIVYITNKHDIHADIPCTVVPTPICFDEVIAAVFEMHKCIDEEQALKNIHKPPYLPSEAQIIVKDGCVIYQGKTVRLTEQELLLFEYLRERSGKTVSRHELRNALWSDAEDGTNVTDVYISYLRRKLKPVLGEGVLLTVRGQGYILNLQ